MRCKPLWFTLLGLSFALSVELYSQDTLVRDLGIEIGIFQAGPKNDITDVGGVRVGHVTMISGDSIRTGVTAILPHGDNLFQEKVPAGIYLANAFGKLAGSTQVDELGNLETPIILTNTLSVAAGIQGVLQFTLGQEGNEDIRSVNAVVGETNDGWLNDIRGMHVGPHDVIRAIETADDGPCTQGNVGAGTGTVCFGFKGGIGSSSRILPRSLGGYRVGVLVQSNFGGVLEIAGVPIGKEMNIYPFKDAINSPDGSCMIVVATDAPLDARNLKRMARRAMLGLAKTGGMSSNGSGDFVIAFSTDKSLRIPYRSTDSTMEQKVLRNDKMSPLFQAVIEASEEAILNSLFAASDLTGQKGRLIKALDKRKVMALLKKYRQ